MNTSQKKTRSKTNSENPSKKRASSARKGSSLSSRSHKKPISKVRNTEHKMKNLSSTPIIYDIYGNPINPVQTAQDSLQQKEQELEPGTSFAPLLEIKTGTHKSKKIHYATLKLGLQNVSDICEKAGFLLNPPQAQLVTDYLYLLQKWNQSMNLVGKHSWKDVLTELVIDSLHLAKFLEENPRIEQDTIPIFESNTSKKYVFNKQNLYADFTEPLETGSINENIKNTFETWDLGAGAGLPGIPLRMFWQLGHYHMIEVREKRSFFLNTAVTTLGLPNTHVFRGKAEEFMSAKRQQNIYADLILSRAFMPFAKMLPFVAPYLRQEENMYKTKPSIIFLTLEELDAKKYNTSDFAWETKTIYPYTIKNKQKFLCEVCFA